MLNYKLSEKSENKSPEKPKIALVMKSLANEFFSTMADGAKKHQQAPIGLFDCWTCLAVTRCPQQRLGDRVLIERQN